MDNLEGIRKRVFYQSQHRGMREMDMLLGGFSEKYINSMTLEDLEQFESLLTFSDQELYGALVEKKPIHLPHSRSLLQTIQHYVDSL